VNGDSNLQEEHLIVEYWKQVLNDNERQGNPWYYGLLRDWWWGKTKEEFLEELPKHGWPRIWPCYNENYDQLYGAIHYAGKKVLDIGADVGSTADFFLRRGTTEVVAVEGSQEMYNELAKNATKIPEIKPIFLYIDKPEHYEQLIKTHHPDVLHADCEGCEKHLFNVSDEVFSMVPEYMVETHGGDVYSAMLEKCKRNDYEIVNVLNYYDASINIVYAKKKFVRAIVTSDVE